MASIGTSQPAGGHLAHVSLLRVAAMITVVVYHSLCFYVVWSHPVTSAGFAAGWGQAYALLANVLVKANMPLFVFLSGFLYAHLRITRGKYTSTPQFVRGKVRRLLVPYLLWSLMLIVCYPAAHHSFAKIPFGFCHLWFLLMLFEEALVFHLTSRWWLRLPRWGMWLLVVAIIALQVYLRVNFGHSHSVVWRLLRQFVVFMPYYALGIALQRCMSTWHRLPWQLFAALAVAALGLQVCNWQWYRLPLSVLTYLLTNCVLLVSLYFCARRLCLQRPSIAANALLRNLDSCCMGIYILHHIVIEVVTHIGAVRQFLCDYYQVGPVALFAAAFGVAWALTYLISVSMRNRPACVGKKNPGRDQAWDFL